MSGAEKTAVLGLHAFTHISPSTWNAHFPFFFFVRKVSVLLDSAPLHFPEDTFLRCAVRGGDACGLRETLHFSLQRLLHCYRVTFFPFSLD